MAQPVGAGPQADPFGGGDILVTARKQEESLIDVPIAVSAFSAASIESRLAQSVTDIAAFTPGFQMNEAFGRTGDRPVIRGASNILFSEGKVGVFLNGAPFFGDFSSLDLGNIERIEVIKGPQSAVFGRGTLSGAVNVVLQRPGDEPTARASATLGNYDRIEAGGSVSLPINSVLGFQAGARITDVDGQFRNQAIPTERLGDQHSEQYTAALFLDPSPDLSASVRWLHQTDKDGHFAIALQPASENNCFMDTRTYYCGKVRAPDQYAINTDKLQRAGLHRNADRFLGELSWDIAGSGYVYSVQGTYSDLNEVQGVDQTYDNREFFILSPFLCNNFIPNALCSQSGFNTTFGIRRKTWTGEARITSPLEDRFRWRVGVFASRDRVNPLKDYVEASEFGLDILDDAKRVENRAVFGGIEFDVTDQLTFGAELRHQRDEVKSIGVVYRADELFSPGYLDGLSNPDPTQIVGTPGTRKAVFKATLPRLTLNWDATDELSFYAQYSQGNTPGGFNDIAAPLSVYEEEKLVNYEVGMKTTGWGFGYLSLSGFWQDYKNQVLTNTFQNGTVFDSYSVNLGKTRIRGIELEGVYPIIGRTVQLQFNYTYLDAEIRRGIEPEQAILELGNGCKTGGEINLDLPGCREAASVAGHRPPLVSKHSGAVGLRTNHEIGGGWTLFSGVDVLYRSSWFAQVHNLARSGDSTRVNLQLGVYDEKGLRITFWGKNVFDDDTPVGIMRYIDMAAGVPRAPTGDYARAFGITPARKPEYGVTVTKNF